MAYLKPISRVGQFFGTVLRGVTYYVEDTEIDIPFGVQIKFFSPSGDYVGCIDSTPDDAGFLGIELTEERIGGLTKFKFSIAREVDIPFYNLMETRFYIQGRHWFTGELQYSPDLDRRNEIYEYAGKGYVSYLDKKVVDLLYENKTIKEIVEDLIENYIANDYPVNWNPDLIAPPEFNIVKLELNNKSIKRALDTLLDIANYDFLNHQYTYGFDRDKVFYFKEILQEENYGFFEGYQYQNPDVQVNIDDIINLVDIYRNQENSQQAEYVSSIQDVTSQALYGTRQKKLTIADYIDQTTIERIGTYMVERFKDPIKSISIDNLEIEEDPYPIGFYFLNNKVNQYNPIISECEEVVDWTRNGTHFTFNSQDEKVLSGKRAFILEIDGASGEYIEFELTEPIMYPVYFYLYAAQLPIGEAINVSFFDEDGNKLVIETGLLLTEDGDVVVTEDEEDLQLEDDTIGINIRIANDYQKLTFDISEIDNIKKCRISFVTDEEFTIYIDRLEVRTLSWLQNSLILDKIKYVQSGSKILANADFGERINTLVDDLKEIDKKQQNVLSIFEKQ